MPSGDAAPSTGSTAKAVPSGQSTGCVGMICPLIQIDWIDFIRIGPSLVEAPSFGYTAHPGLIELTPKSARTARLGDRDGSFLKVPWNKKL
jgi:hypothetical protein